ncbi:MAG: hypothetical protein RBR06_06190 [Desulfuromonadaceae bacterium]|nr:hypothetical protein [Desulfuromonadaceae bacterium]
MSKQITREQWQRVEEALSGVFGRVDLMVDGRKVTFERRLVAENRLGIMTYINGELKGCWTNPNEQHDEQRYLRERSCLFYSKKDRNYLKKLGKLTLNRMKVDADRRYEWYDQIWTRAGAIRRHYEKTFTSIELIEAIG